MRAHLINPIESKPDAAQHHQGLAKQQRPASAHAENDQIREPSDLAYDRKSQASLSALAAHEYQEQQQRDADERLMNEGSDSIGNKHGFRFS